MDDDTTVPRAEPAKDAARAAAADQAVRLLFAVVAIPVLIGLQRAASDPDASRRLVMRAARIRERLLAAAAAACWKAAERARLDYEKQRG